MAMSMEESGGHWFSQMPRTGRIYQLIDEAGKAGFRSGRVDAIVALGECRDPRAVDVLVTCCQDRDPSIRKNAVAALGRMKSGRAVPALVRCIRDRDEVQEIRMEAACALASTRCESAFEGLRGCLEDEKVDPAVRSLVEEALTEIRT